MDRILSARLTTTSFVSSFPSSQAVLRIREINDVIAHGTAFGRIAFSCKEEQVSFYELRLSSCSEHSERNESTVIMWGHSCKEGLASCYSSYSLTFKET